MDESVMRDELRRAALDPEQVRLRHDVATFTASVFESQGERWYVVGHIIGEDRVSGRSPFGRGHDATVAVSMLLRTAGQLISTCSDLTERRTYYAASSLVRQLVEVEYLAFTFADGHDDSARWLRSTRAERQQFFTPKKLRDAAGGRFRGVDYGYHCELGGHPTPRSWILLDAAGAVGQLMLSDAIGHAAHIWNHALDWAKRNGYDADSFPNLTEMSRRYAEWKANDNLTDLLPPPEAL